MHKIGSEELVLLSLARSVVGSGDTAVPDDVDPDEIEWGKVLRLAIRQKIFPLVFTRLLEGELERSVSKAGLKQSIIDLLEVQELRGVAQQRLAVGVQQVLRDLKIESLARKGLVYDELLYGGRGLRRSRDLDLFVLEESAKSAELALSKAGFEFGATGYALNEMKSLPKNEILLRRLYPDHTPRLLKEVNIQFVKYLEVDLSFNFAWFGSEIASSRALLDEAFSGSVEVAGLKTMTRPFHFLDCCLHIFREAFFEQALVESGRMGVTLHKFIDLALLRKCLSDAECDQLRSLLARDERLSQLVRWAAHHADVALETDVSSFFGSRDQTNINNLYSWARRDGSIAHWKGDIKQRLFGDEVSVFGYALTARR